MQFWKKNSIPVSLFTEKCITLIIVQNFLIVGQNNYCNKIPNIMKIIGVACLKMTIKSVEWKIKCLFFFFQILHRDFVPWIERIFNNRRSWVWKRSRICIIQSRNFYSSVVRNRICCQVNNGTKIISIFVGQRLHIF